MIFLFIMNKVLFCYKFLISRRFLWISLDKEGQQLDTVFFVMNYDLQFNESS